MLERVDRIQLAVADAADAALAFQDILGAEPAREETSDYLNARRTVLTPGTSEVELCAPLGAGIARAHLDRWGPGLLTAGFSVVSVAALRAHLFSEGVDFTKEGEQTYLEPTETAGMRVVVSPGRDLAAARAHQPSLRGDQHAGVAVGGGRQALCAPLRPGSLTLLANYQRALRLHRHPHPLRPARPPGSHRDLPGDPAGHRDGPLGRPARRLALHVLRRDRRRGRRRAAPHPPGRALHPRGGDPAAERDGLWIHPSALSGLLLGISRTTVAWEWSGQPERVVH
jgi:hypothetical protein